MKIKSIKDNIKSIKDNIDSVGINLFCYNCENEKISEIFIKEVLFNYHTIKSNNPNKIIEVLRKDKDKKFIIYYTIQEMDFNLDKSSHLNISFQYSKYLRILNQICFNNNLSLILKSFTSFTSFTNNSKYITRTMGMNYEAKLIISFNGDNMEIHKSRYLSSGITFSLKNQLKKHYRKEKLKKFQI